uniref:PDZ domain-containing protein n=1 Tax=Salmonella sp. s51228 TaxID=3159652 RepID=UPI0039817CC6
RGINTANSPTIISRVMEGGVAARTAAVHVGDEILSINGISLKDKTLVEAARMMEDAEIVVAIQIRRADTRCKIRDIFEGTKEYHVQYPVVNPMKSPVEFPRPVTTSS